MKKYSFIDELGLPFAYEVYSDEENNNEQQ